MGQALAGAGHVTEHIGSTAVPGLVAKPIIDLDVVVTDQDAAAAAIDALTAAGWQHEGDLGITGRAAFRPRAGAAYHHLSVVTRGSQAHHDHIDLRDYLREHPREAARYAELKHQLAPLLSADRAAYTESKANLITELLTRARGNSSSLERALPAADQCDRWPGLTALTLGGGGCCAGRRVSA